MKTEHLFVFHRLLAYNAQRDHFASPAHRRHSPNVGWKLAHRLRRWSSIHTTLGERLVFAGSSLAVSLGTDSEQTGEYVNDYGTLSVHKPEIWCMYTKIDFIIYYRSKYRTGTV